jgi:hypothetical protein
MTGIKAIAQFVTQRIGDERVVITIKDKDLTSYSFANKKFENFVFIDCNLGGIDITNAELINVKFKRCQLTLTNFTGSLLSDVMFHKCSGQGANFSHANIIRPMFSMSFFKDAIFKGTTIPTFHGYLPCFKDVDFTNAEKIDNTFVLVGNFKGVDAKPEMGFRTKKGGSDYYKIPTCSKQCITDPTFCRQACNINTNPDKFVVKGG